MKSTSSVLLAMLLALAITPLAGCGSSEPANDAASGGAEQEDQAEQVAVDPAEKFVGTWKLAAVESEGITMVGDFSMMFEEAKGMSLSLAKDGTGSMSFGEDSADLTWELASDDVATLTVAKSDDESGDEESVVGDDGTIQVSYENGRVVMAMATSKEEGEEGDTEKEGVEEAIREAKLVFTTDGTAEGYPVISADDAQDISSKDTLLGTWRLTGMNFFGITMYGDADSLAKMVGDADSATVIFDEDGKATLLGDEATWALGDDGASIDVGTDSAVSVKSFGEGILIDMGNVVGLDMVFVFSK